MSRSCSETTSNEIEKHQLAGVSGWFVGLLCVYDFSVSPSQLEHGLAPLGFGFPYLRLRLQFGSLR